MLDVRVFRIVGEIRQRRLLSLSLFAYVFLAQLGHLVEHISVAIQGKGLLGSQFDSELSHLLFNSTIAILCILVALVHPRNPWVYPLCILTVFHAIEHVYIFEQFVRIGLTNGPGLLGRGGAIGVIPLERLDLHNVYNGLEVVLLGLGMSWEIEEELTEKE